MEETTGRRSLAEVRDLQKQVGDWGRDDFHKMAEAIHVTAVTVAVIQERQTAQSGTLSRIEAAVTKFADKTDDHSGRIVAIETRADESRSNGAKWGAGLGGLIAAIIAGLAQLFSGGK